MVLEEEDEEEADMGGRLGAWLEALAGELKAGWDMAWRRLGKVLRTGVDLRGGGWKLGWLA